MRSLETVSEVIDALGGPKRTGQIVGRSPQSACNWKNRAKRFPADTFPALNEALAERGYTAPPSLWRIIERTN